jgi:hypothetical protein
MGYGEKQMKLWGMTAAGVAMGLCIFTLVLAILTIVTLTSSTDLDTKNNTIIFAGVMVGIVVAVAIVAGIGFWKVYKANQIYLKVSSDAATGKIELTKPAAPAQTDTKPVAPAQTDTKPVVQQQPPSPRIISTDTETDTDNEFL